jgi:hypothetical protein
MGRRPSGSGRWALTYFCYGGPILAIRLIPDALTLCAKGGRETGNHCLDGLELTAKSTKSPAWP